ncbi:phosphoadenosine phosphosulfate reductase family protein [Dysgonomonas sp. 511]|uniref:phosphoadenosine phosphosulfate reductase family protein n=1 Tax=Dysgonomonas sp. 511 TaxID=2302930 RepID=UPI0013D81E97|nr:phosphoadenosine phosphosulfate reductase family protein [Dysgonomonas sp. 511]NDV77876.1 hypothetical protein [Dysgonomonas sp. 511]
MKILNTLSGGKDSLASTLWLLNNGYKKFTTVFCDTKWESEITYKHIDNVVKQLGLDFRVLKSKKYDGLIDLSRRKTRFPSTTRRFCTSELKNIPMIDYILDEVRDHILVIQGIRAGESESRSKMSQQCNYFKYYLEPIETNFALLPKLKAKLSTNLSEDKREKLLKRIDKIEDRLSKGKLDPQYHTYRRKEVLEYCKKYSTDVLRPVFDWTGQQVINYILDNDLEPNPLYRMGLSRVGCFPCINCNLMEIHQISQRFPERIYEIEKAEMEIGSTFFPYDKISNKYCKQPGIRDIVAYVKSKYDSGDIFEELTDDYTSCMSYYGLCE